MADLIFEPMYIVAGMLRRREVSSVELVEAALAQVERHSERLNPFITMTAETARERARERDAEFSAGIDRGPLHGIPIVLKDLFDTAGSCDDRWICCLPGADTAGGCDGRASAARGWRDLNW